MNWAALALAAVWLAAGDRLPPIRGNFLSGRAAVLFDAATGKVTLLLLGFSYDSRFAVEAWAKRFRQDFGSEPRATYFEVPMIGGMARLGKWFIDSGMRRGTPKADHEHVITVYGNTDDWKKRVAFRDPKAAYPLLLYPHGNIVWRHAGALEAGAYDEVSSAVKMLFDGK